MYSYQKGEMIESVPKKKRDAMLKRAREVTDKFRKRRATRGDYKALSSSFFINKLS